VIVIESEFELEKSIVKKIVLALCALSLLSACGDKGNGEKNGLITKLATTGFFCKTHEMEIQRGGFNAGTGANGAPFEVTIEDPKLYEIAKQAIDERAEVQITYHTELNSFCRSDSQDNFLTGIKIIRSGSAVKAAESTAATVTTQGGTTLSGPQVQQMLDNQTRSTEQTGRLIKLLEERRTS
jgi:hypothetical protein